MKKVLTVALVAAMLVLTACSAISAGRITAKNVYPAHYNTSYICSAYNSQGICTVNVPIMTYVEEQYSFDLADGEKTGWVYVSGAEFNEYEVGDTYAGSPEGN